MEDSSNMPDIQTSQGAKVSAVAITMENVPEKLKGLKMMGHLDQMDYAPGF